MFSFVCFPFNFSPPIPYSVACIFLSEVQLHRGLAESFGRVPNRKLVGDSPKLHRCSIGAPPKLTGAPPELTATSVNTFFRILTSFPSLALCRDNQVSHHNHDANYPDPCRGDYCS
jgi:hypothetical protein